MHRVSAGESQVISTAQQIKMYAQVASTFDSTAQPSQQFPLSLDLGLVNEVIAFDSCCSHLWTRA